ncbi:hypothetical protein T261_5875 [Streptomyces lydicus]|nr:hypothetical protein T261_5875 [Streptomyces lydicus]
MTGPGAPRILPHPQREVTGRSGGAVQDRHRCRTAPRSGSARRRRNGERPPRRDGRHRRAQAKRSGQANRHPPVMYASDPRQRPASPHPSNH